MQFVGVQHFIQSIKIKQRINILSQNILKFRIFGGIAFGCFYHWLSFAHRSVPWLLILFLKIDSVIVSATWFRVGSQEGKFVVREVIQWRVQPWMNHRKEQKRRYDVVLAITSAYQAPPAWLYYYALCHNWNTICICLELWIALQLLLVVFYQVTLNYSVSQNVESLLKYWSDP